jgi:serine/threonine protein kinase
VALLPGTTLASFEILGPLGAGAMGEVYLAKDTRLDRQVAIKVLPDHFASDVERLQRFEREAKTLASLNHPNAQISASTRSASCSKARARSRESLGNARRGPLSRGARAAADRRRPRGATSR